MPSRLWSCRKCSTVASRDASVSCNMKMSSDICVGAKGRGGGAREVGAGEGGGQGVCMQGKQAVK